MPSFRSIRWPLLSKCPNQNPYCFFLKSKKNQLFYNLDSKQNQLFTTWIQKSFNSFISLKIYGLFRGVRIRRGPIGPKLQWSCSSDAANFFWMVFGGWRLHLRPSERWQSIISSNRPCGPVITILPTEANLHWRLPSEGSRLLFSTLRTWRRNR